MMREKLSDEDTLRGIKEDIDLLKIDMKHVKETPTLLNGIIRSNDNDDSQNSNGNGVISTLLKGITRSNGDEEQKIPQKSNQGTVVINETEITNLVEKLLDAKLADRIDELFQQRLEELGVVQDDDDLFYDDLDLSYQESTAHTEHQIDDIERQSSPMSEYRPKRKTKSAQVSSKDLLGYMHRAVTTSVSRGMVRIFLDKISPLLSVKSESPFE